MGDFPSFWDGALLFCGGHLALGCCSVDEYSPWYSGSWESHGQDFRDPPCSAPTDWDGNWVIGTVCGGHTCGGSRPKVGVSMNWDSPCTYYGAVLTDWMLGRVSINMGIAPFTGTGSWTVWGAGCTLSKSVAFTEGHSAYFEFILPEGCGDIFGTPGRATLQSRMTVDFPGVGLQDHDSTVYLFVAEYPGERTSGELAIYPSLMGAYDAQLILAKAIEDEERKYSLLITDLKRGYATEERAREVLTANETALADYAEKCACGCNESESGDPICTAGEIPPNWDGPWSPGFAGCESEPGGSSCATVHFTWGVDMTGGGYSFKLQVRNGPYESWITLAEGEAPRFIECSGTIPPCGEARAYLLADSAHGEYFFSGDWYRTGTNTRCTPAIEAAFETVPAY